MSGEQATDTERRAARVVSTITAKGPEFTLAVHQRLTVEVKNICHPWDILIGTSMNDFHFYRPTYDGVTIAARVKQNREGQWIFGTPDKSTGSGIKESPHAAMDAVDDHLRLSGMTLMPGRPTTGPWVQVEGTSHWVRNRLNGPMKSHLVRVGQANSKQQGSNWYWMLTKISGPGPTDDHGPWATKELAMQQADTALENVGWTIPSP